MPEALPVAGVSAALFSALALMSDRPRGALIAQIALFLAGGLLLFASVRESAFVGISPRMMAALATGVIAAALSGMFYHLYIGRFERVWAARAVFTAIYLAASGVLSLVFLALMGAREG